MEGIAKAKINTYKTTTYPAVRGHSGGLTRGCGFELLVKLDSFPPVLNIVYSEFYKNLQKIRDSLVFQHSAATGAVGSAGAVVVSGGD